MRGLERLKWDAALVVAWWEMGITWRLHMGTERGVPTQQPVSDGGVKSEGGPPFNEKACAACSPRRSA
jgi:hypothetical protein